LEFVSIGSLADGLYLGNRSYLVWETFAEN